MSSQNRDKVIKQFEETISKLEINMVRARRGVKQAAEKMIANTREREREALESLEATRVSRLHKINLAKQEVESLVKQMNQAAQFAENLVQRTSSSDIMQNKETLKTKFEELLRVEVPKHQQTTFMKFTAASHKDLKLGFFEVAEGTAKAAKSTIEGLDQTFQAGVRESEFKLCPKTSGGEISKQANLKGRVELVVVGELKLKLFPGDTLKGLNGIDVNTEGQIVVTDNFGNCVYVFDKDGNCLRKTGGEGSNTGQFQYPDGISFLNDNEVLIAD